MKLSSEESGSKKFCFCTAQLSAMTARNEHCTDSDKQRDCRASPDIAPYPFTTLMPNLGVLMASTQPDVQQDDFSDFDFNHLNGSSVPDVAAPILADMPGLIQGAHAGRGLGRMFLRHLRRTRGLLHVVDASAGALISCNAWPLSARACALSGGRTSLSFLHACQAGLKVCFAAWHPISLGLCLMHDSRTHH